MATPRPFTRVSPEVSFPELEQRILSLWNEIDAFKTSVAMHPEESEFTFYDGSRPHQVSMFLYIPPRNSNSKPSGLCRPM